MWQMSIDFDEAKGRQIPLSPEMFALQLAPRKFTSRGDKITVVKQGSQLGKKGVVEKPAWMGRVRVKMDQTGAIKSYLCEGS